MENSNKKIRVAGYTDEEMLAQLDAWCQQEGLNRNEGLRHIIHTMLNIYEDSTEYDLQVAVSLLEKGVKRLKSAKMEIAA